MRARLSGLPAEEFWAIAVDVRHRVVFDAMLARGSLTGVEIHPRDVFRPLIKAGAAAVLFCHYVARNIMAILCPAPLCCRSPV
jgi:DNA repair protein RadC